MRAKATRFAFSLVELLVVIGIISTLIGLILPAVQSVRGMADRTQCANNLRQIGLALHLYHDSHKAFPPGVRIDFPKEPYPYLSWRIRIAPFLEQDAYWRQTLQDYQTLGSPFPYQMHQGLASPIPIFGCPSDPRVWNAQPYNGYSIALSSYLGVEGTDFKAQDGVLIHNTRINMTQITDGLSNTLLVGERPPSDDFRYGWLYAANGQWGTGSLDHVLGVREIATEYSRCPPGPYHFVPQRLSSPCAFMNFWSWHSGGSNFLAADGSVHFLTYSADEILPALATRAGGEIENFP